MKIPKVELNKFNRLFNKGYYKFNRLYESPYGWDKSGVALQKGFKPFDKQLQRLSLKYNLTLEEVGEQLREYRINLGLI